MATLHLVPHTHWDREWYLPFQVFRLKLVHMLDLLIDTFERDPAFTAFTLDGQTSILEDYLEIRPERRKQLESWVRQGRLLIGPWYVLPDEFLVSPEALVRNLLTGCSDCAGFGARMDVGYIPDPFGHIGQMPQILRGFGIDCAAFRRGLDDQPCELWWEAPDGSRLLTAYLRDGYDNAARLPTTTPAFGAAIAAGRDSLAPHCATTHRLLLNGTDHQEPQTEIPALAAEAWTGPDRLLLSSLPRYLDAVRSEIAAGLLLPVVRGELRSPKRHHLLPAVLSSRTWIKQRNQVCETLLERWVEPFSAWAGLWGGPHPDHSVFTGHLETPRIRRVQPIIRHAWRLLLQCQPHDSICGCSIDPVHDEMRARFDQVEQIGEELTRQSLQALADEVDTQSTAPPGTSAALLVFNSTDWTPQGRLRAEFDLPAGLQDFEIVDAAGHPIPFQLVRRYDKVLAEFDLDPEGLRGMLAMVKDGRVLGLAVQAVAVVPQPSGAWIDVVLGENAAPNLACLADAQARLAELFRDASRTALHLIVRLASRAEIEGLAPGIPAHGYRSLWIRPCQSGVAQSSEEPASRIENDCLTVEADVDGTLHLTDKRTGRSYAGLLRFSDRAECGDSYTFCPLDGDLPIEAPSSPSQVKRLRSAVGETLLIRSAYRLPRGLAPDRSARSREMVTLPIEVRVHLSPGVPRADVDIRLDNPAEDHRLQVLFPTGSPTQSAWYGGAYEIVSRPTAPAQGGTDWAEQPAAEAPMRNFVADRRRGGLMVAARGLREASVSPHGVLAITLLRCFGWLSRDDLATRKGGAGPLVETPGGQERGPQHFELSLVPFEADLLDAIPLAEAFQAGLRAVTTPQHAGHLPPAASLLALDPACMQLTAIKAAEAGSGLIVRAVNLSAHTVTATLTSHLPIRHASRARLDETPLEDLVVEGRGIVRTSAGPHAVVTFRLECDTT
jgi:mannosylglycerate hydrolase